MNATDPSVQNTRLPAFVRPARDPASTLKAMWIAIIGAGAIGLRIAREIASLHPKAVDVVDPKVTKAESVFTHGTGYEDVFQFKVHLAAKMINASSSTTSVTAVPAGIADVDPSRAANWDFAFLATDNLAAEVEAGQLCRHYGVPLLHVSVDGDTLFAQARLFGNRDEEGPCPACQLSAREWGHANRAVRFSCDGSAHTLEEEPTRSTGSLCAVAAGLAVNLFIRHAVGLGPDRRDHVVEYAGYTDTMTATPLSRDPACPCDHSVFQNAPEDGAVLQATPRELARRAGIENEEASAATQFAVEGRRWIKHARCSRCGQTWLPDRFMYPHRLDSVHCIYCGPDAGPCHLFAQPWVSGRQLSDAADTGLSEICDGRPSAVMVRAPGGQPIRFSTSEELT